MRQRAIWLTAAVLAVIVLLAQIAGASTREDTGSSRANTTVAAQQMNTAVTVSLPEQASSAGQDHSAKGIATANESIAEHGKSTTANEVVANAPAAAPKDSTSGASGPRPGWGCGDTNHTHSGPPGRPNATPPPGCTRP